MRNRLNCSKASSALVRLFVERSGLAASRTSPEAVMAALIERSRPKKPNSQINQLEQFLAARNVKSIEVSADLDCDGLIRPLGHRFSEGFEMLLKETPSEVRSRFTKAHEGCHTFFYELVPELKFRPHDTDETEERLCNLGAAILLIPQKQLSKEAKHLSVCLDSLQMLAQRFIVSLPAMLLRLKSLNLWRCELSLWHKMSNGNFSLDRLYGGKRADWEWVDDRLLERAWNSNESIFGHTFVRYASDRGNHRYKPVSFNLRRSSNGVIALWGDGISQPQLATPLFESRERVVGGK